MLRFFVNLQKKGPIFAAGLSTFWLVEREKIFVPLLNHILYFSAVYHMKTSFVVLRTLFLFFETTKACSLTKTIWSLNRTTKRTRDAARFVNLQNKWPIFDGVKIRRTVDGGKNPQAQREPGETRWCMGAQRDFGARLEY